MTPDLFRRLVLQWLELLSNPPKDACLQVGLLWDPNKKWRVYQRLGEAMVITSGAEAKKFMLFCEEEMPDIVERNIALESLVALACDAEQRNRDGVVPEGGGGFLPPQGAA